MFLPAQGYLAYVACSRAALRRATPKVRHCRANKAQQCCRGPEPGMVLPHLSSVKQWHSSKTRRRESITVVTQLSIERCVRTTIVSVYRWAGGWLQVPCSKAAPFCLCTCWPCLGRQATAQDCAYHFC